MLAFVAILTASCSNDEIEIEKVTPTRTITYNVSTQGMFDEFGITDDIKTDNLSGNYSIGVYAFLYDDNNNLVVADSTYTKTFNPTNISFADLKEGSYTSVFVEMLVNTSTTRSDVWNIEGKETLETLEIAYNDSIANYLGVGAYNAIGVSTEVINVNNNQDYIVAPKAIGSVVFLEFFHFNNQDEYNVIDLFTKNKPRGRKLSPTYKGTDVLDYDSYTEDHKWHSRSMVYRSNGLEASIYDDTAYLIEFGDMEYTISPRTYTKNEGFSSFRLYPQDAHIAFEDGKTYYGGLLYVGGSGYDCEGFLGSQDEYMQWKNAVLYNYTEPCLSWNQTVSWVKQYMEKTNVPIYEDMKFYSDINVYRLGYCSDYADREYDYWFTSSDGELLEADVLYYYSTYDKVVENMSGLYEYVDKGTLDDGCDYTIFQDAIKTTTLQVTDYKNLYGYVGIVYVPYIEISAQNNTKSKNNKYLIRGKKLSSAPKPSNYKEKERP